MPTACWLLRRGADAGIYSSDFQHANARGHAVAAAGVIERLGERLREQAAAA